MNNPSLIIVAERFLGVLLVIVGLSHVLAARLWASLFTDCLRHPSAGLVLGLLTLLVGLPIVLVHNVWVPHFALLTTLIGWGWTVKGTLYLLRPATPERVSRGLLTPGKFVLAGAVLLVIGAAICFGAFLPPG